MRSLQHVAPSEIIQASELAERLKCGKSTVYSLAKAGRIPTIGLGKKGVRFDYTAVLEALKK
jgi:excisionase family DNA binding protein